VFVGSNPTLSETKAVSVVVARIGFSATTSRESRQGRKAAAAAAMSGAGVPADTGRLLMRCAQIPMRCAQLSWGCAKREPPKISGAKTRR
jgi:hypothetical protein